MSEPYCEAEFLKICMLKAADIICPNKWQAVSNISLTRNSVADTILDLTGDLKLCKLGHLLHIQLQLIGAITDFFLKW